MSNKKISKEELLIENQRLRNQLDDIKSILRTLKSGDTDVSSLGCPSGDELSNLKGAGELYRVIVESMGEGVLACATDGTILFCNRRFAEMVNCTPSQLVGTPVQVHVSKDEQDPLTELIGQANSFPVFRKMNLRFSDGSTNVVIMSFTSFKINHLEVVVAVITDLSELDSALLALRRNQKIFNHFMKFSPIYVFFKDKNLRSIELSQNFEEMLGRPLQELLGKTMYDLFPQEFAEKMIADDTQILKSGKARTVEEEFNGRIYRTIKFPIFFEGEPSFLAGYTMDITDAKLAEEELKESEFFFKESQRLARIGSYKCNLTTGRWESSEVLDGIFGIDEDFEKNISGWLSFVHLDDREMMEKYLNEEVIQRKKPFDKEYRIIRQSDGEIRWVRGQGSLVSDGDDGSLLLMGTIQDTTEKNKVIEEQETLKLQLQHAQHLEGLGRLAGGVAHDFNNMLSVILGVVDIIHKKDIVPKPLHDPLMQIQIAAERSADIVKQLLGFARKQPVAPKVLDLNQTLNEMIKMLHRLIGEGIELDFLSAPDLWPIKIDPAQINQILVNLCVNARDALDGRGKILIETQNSCFDTSWERLPPEIFPGDYVLLTVSDNGCGMDQNVLDKIFEPFFTTQKLGKGTGLGLSTVYGIVKQNNGYIYVSSRKGEGTQFDLYFPRCSDSMVSTPTKTDNVQKQGGETILVVEDDPTILEINREILELHGYYVLTANGPKEAIQITQGFTKGIDLLLTDVIMPEMNGKELAQQILSSFPELKVLYTSGYTDDIISGHGGIIIEENFIQKPFPMDTLLAKVRQVIDS